MIRKRMEVYKVFIYFIKFLVDILFDKLKGVVLDILLDDIYFVLIVSVIWDDLFKQFMREVVIVVSFQIIVCDFSW